jgi:hypothetical protein
MDNDSVSVQQSGKWFEQFGARGLATLGAAWGLVISLIIVLGTAPRLPARPAKPKSEQPVQLEKPREAKPASPAKRDLIAAPQPLVSTPKAEAAVSVPSASNAVATNSVQPFVSPPELERSVSEPAPSASASMSTSEQSSGSSYSASGGGTVHVRGYYRKNGTYVQPHTRRSPRR